MDEYAFDGDGLGVETDNPMESTAFDYIPSGDSPYGEGALTETDASPYALDYNGPETHDPGMGPGMVQTDYGAHPWGTGAGGGYRPMSQSRTDDQPLGSTEAQRRLGVQQPSNAAIDPETIYDRQSYEYASGDTVGAGIFDMPEGVTWNANDGVFANNYAMPGYMAKEPMMYPAPSAMIDTQTGLPTIVQPSASGVQLSMEAPPGTPVYSPFRQMTAITNRTPVPRVPYAQTPRGMSGLGAVPPAQPAYAGQSAAEAFGNQAAIALVRRAALMKTPGRERFVANAMSVLGPQRSAAAEAAVRKLMAMGYPSTHVVEQVFAHCIMHAVVGEVMRVARTGRPVPPAQSVVRAATTVAAQAGPAPDLADAAQRVVPALVNQQAARAELAAFSRSLVRPQVRATLGSDGLEGMGSLGDGAAPEPGTPTAPRGERSEGMSTGAKVAIALGTVTAVGAAWTYRDKIAKWFGGDQ
jgi:hypothetical protein